MQFIAPSNAAVKPGSACTKLNSTSTSSGFKYTCIKSGSKLVWNKGVKVATPTPTPVETRRPQQITLPSNVKFLELNTPILLDIRPEKSPRYSLETQTFAICSIFDEYWVVPNSIGKCTLKVSVKEFAPYLASSVIFSIDVVAKPTTPATSASPPATVKPSATPTPSPTVLPSIAPIPTPTESVRPSVIPTPSASPTPTVKPSITPTPTSNAAADAAAKAAADAAAKAAADAAAAAAVKKIKYFTVTGTVASCSSPVYTSTPGTFISGRLLIPYDGVASKPSTDFRNGTLAKVYSGTFQRDFVFNGGRGVNGTVTIWTRTSFSANWTLFGSGYWAATVAVDCYVYE